MTNASQQSPPPAGPQPTAAGAAATAWDLPWPAAPRPRRQPFRATAVAMAVCASVGLLGIPLGLVWASVTPSIPVRKADDAAALLAEAQPEQFAAADAWFSLLGVAFGVAAAVAVWLVARRWRGPLVLLALAVGGVLAGLLAWWLGSKVGVGDYERMLASASPGTVLEKPGDLRASEVEVKHGFLPVIRGNVLLPALGAVLSYTLMAGWSRFATLRPHLEPDELPDLPDLPDLPAELRDPPEELPDLPAELRSPTDGQPDSSGPVSSGSTATPAPPAVPVPPGPGAAVPPPG